MGTFLTKFIILLVIAFVLSLGIFSWIGIAVSLDAEKKLHAYDLVVCVVADYVQRKQVWPSSWRELRDCGSCCSSDMWEWPEDQSLIESRVGIDFGSNIEIATSGANGLERSIFQKGTHYPLRQGQIKRSIDALKEVKKHLSVSK